jgi:hypothetical protein
MLSDVELLLDTVVYVSSYLVTSFALSLDSKFQRSSSRSYQCYLVDGQACNGPDCGQYVTRIIIIHQHQMTSYFTVFFCCLAATSSVFHFMAYLHQCPKWRWWLHLLTCGAVLVQSAEYLLVQHWLLLANGAGVKSH